MASEVSPEGSERRTFDLRAPAKGANINVLGLIPQPGEWLAVYSVMRLGKRDGATIADVCALSDLPGPQRKRADAWMGQFGRLITASMPRAAG
jgi:hypothetical protein